jgi:hypothetical protein
MSRGGNGGASAVVLDLHVARLEQLFDSMDPSPFHERDLDPRAVEFIVGWAREQRSDRALCLAVRLDVGSNRESAEILRQAVTEYFRERALATRRQLRELLRNGRISLAIGLSFVAVALVAADLAGGLGYGILKESFVIGGWVALWRPLEIFLYDWWPIRAEAQRYDRLAAMTVELVPAAAAGDS